MSDLPLRPNVCMLVVNADDQFLLCERLDEADHWQFPQGGVEEDVSLEANALRELHEELGANFEHFAVEQVLTPVHDYDFKKPRVYGGVTYRGQRQRFVLVRYLGQDADFDLQRYHPELQSFRWCSLEEVRRLAVPRRLIGYEAALTEAAGFLESRRSVQSKSK